MNLKTVILDLCLDKKKSGRDITWLSSPHENEKPLFSNSSGLKSVFDKLRFRDGLVWTVGLAIEIKLRFQIPPA